MSCQPADTLIAAQNPVPPTPTSSPTGISGKVEYAGTMKGGILIFAMDKPPAANEAPQPTALSGFTDVTGDFQWDLPPGTYYIIAFLTIDRPPEGPPRANEPAVYCEPIDLGVDERINVEVILTNEDIGGNNTSCVIAE